LTYHQGEMWNMFSSEPVSYKVCRRRQLLRKVGWYHLNWSLWPLISSVILSCLLNYCF